ncbi:mycothiol system anti-sigma-R factor [Luteococcus japonicus]|nr:mycothiol system anti-sigma-R factor [Luteococcus japonicus]
MTDPAMSHAEDHDACTEALGHVQVFLHGELTECDADLVRHHLDACEKCLENYDIEQTIATLIKRCNPPQAASTQLRMRIISMSLTLHER